MKIFSLSLEVTRLEGHPADDEERGVQPEEDGVAFCDAGPGDLLLEEVDPVCHAEGDKDVLVVDEEGNVLQHEIDEEDT